MQITPIQTRWKNYFFRSRLEARWAVFFENMGLDWEYEPQGYTVNGQGYLPDFRIKSNGAIDVVNGSEWVDHELLFYANHEGEQLNFDGYTYYEVKPQSAGTCRSAQLLGAVHLFGDPYHFFFERPGNTFCGMCSRIDSCAFKDSFYEEFETTKMLMYCKSCFMKVGADSFSGDTTIFSPQYHFLVNEQASFDSPLCHMNCYNLNGRQRIYDAATAAREARFEHGESPRLIWDRAAGIDPYTLAEDLDNLHFIRFLLEINFGKKTITEKLNGKTREMAATAICHMGGGLRGFDWKVIEILKKSPIFMTIMNYDDDFWDRQPIPDDYDGGWEYSWLKDVDTWKKIVGREKEKYG